MLTALVMRCLEKAPDDRPQSAAQVLQELDAVAPSQSPSASPAQRGVLRGLRRRALSTPGIAAASTLLLALATFVAYRGLVPQRGAVASSAAAANSVAVLPFVNLSADRENEYFSDGMTEELINALSKVDGLAVAARTSSFAFKGKEGDVRIIARDLGVRTVVEGSVRRSDNRLRITAQLVDASSGYHLWSEDYDRDVRDVFALQDEISRAVATQLVGRLLTTGPRPLVRPPTEDLAAYNLYLKGRYYWNWRTRDGVLKARDFFTQAIALDSGYALAYVGLADTYNVLVAYVDVPPGDAYPRAKEAALKALAIDNSLAEAHTSLAQAVAEYDWDWARAEQEYARALAINPRYPTAHHWFGIEKALRGQAAEAIRELTRAQELDPLSPIIGTQLGEMFYLARRYEEAVAQARRVIDLDPSFVRAYRELGWAYLKLGRYDDARAAFRTALTVAGDAPGAEMAYVDAVSARRDAARAALASLEACCRLHEPNGRRYGFEYVAPVQMAWLYAAVGDTDRAFKALEDALDRRYMPGFLELDPRFDPLRSDPRFQKLLRRLRLST